MMAGLADAPPVGRDRLRLALIAGPVVFLVVGLGGLWLGDAFLAYPVAYAKPLIVAIEFAMLLTVAVTLGLLVAGPPERSAAAMSATTVFGLCAARGGRARALRPDRESAAAAARSSPSICSAAACSCSSASSRAGARRRGSAAIRSRRRSSSPESSSRLRRRPWRSRCCCGCSRQPARPRCAPTRRRVPGTDPDRRLMPPPAPGPGRGDDDGRVPAGAGDRRAGGGRAARLRRRRAPASSGSRWRPCRSASRSPSRSPSPMLQTGGAARLSARRMGAAARRGAARGRAVGGHDGDHGRRDLRRRRLCARGFPHPCRVGRGPRAVRVLDPAAGDLGRAEHGLPGRRSVHAVRRAGAADLRRGAAGLPGWPRGDAAGRAALSALRAARLGPLSGRHGAALRRVRHARHRAAVRAGPRRARDARRGRADDGGAPRQDRALPAASLAAAGACRRAGRRPARCCRRWW